tara:strand:- start:1174 stop:1686 length:513 start_codon:yes stop_codon:yes gene_type:complete
MKKIRKIIQITFFILILLILILFLSRLILPTEIDDISPEIFCKKDLLKKSDILWVIPKFNDKPVSENKKWCDYILSLNKTIGLHGIYHNYYEFETTKDQEYLKEGINIFEECFKFTPKIFKAPQLTDSKENKKLVKENNLKLKGKFNQITHKVYHCDDSGLFSNRFIDFF